MKLNGRGEVQPLPTHDHGTSMKLNVANGISASVCSIFDRTLTAKFLSQKAKEFSTNSHLLHGHTQQD